MTFSIRLLPHKIAWIFFVVISLGFTIPSWAENDTQDGPSGLDLRFSSGWVFAQLPPGPSPLVVNTNPNFVGYGYNFSAVGWIPASFRSVNVALIAPIVFEDAAHYQPNVGSTFTWDNQNTSTIYTGTVASNPFTDEGVTDGSVGILTQAFSEADGLTPLRVLDISSGNYNNQPILIFGSEPSGPPLNEPPGQQVGSASIYDVVDGEEGPQLTGTYQTGNVGDSGSPVLLTYDGQVTMAGSLHSGDGSGSSPLRPAAGGFNPQPGFNNTLTPYGYALRFVIYDKPTDTANTANVWTGGAGTGAFGTAANWNQGVTPVNLPAVFDTTANAGQTTVNLGGTQSLRGILFRSTTSTTGGFTFTGGTLDIDSTGIENEAGSTQTFNTNMVLQGSQNWETMGEAGTTGGNLVVNGNVATQGNLLVIDGAYTTTLAGVISGGGALAKDESGTLIVGGTGIHDTYAGTTFLHAGAPASGEQQRAADDDEFAIRRTQPGHFQPQRQQSDLGRSPIDHGRSRTVTLGGGALTVGTNGQNTTYSGVFSGSGSVTKTGFGTWSVTGSSTGFTGSLGASGGTFLVDTTIGNGNITAAANNGGILGGTGTISGTGALNAGGFISPGAGGIGTLTLSKGLNWAGDSTMMVDLGAPGSSDLLNLGTGALTKTTPGAYVFDFNNDGGMAPGTYNLIDYGSTNFSASNFSYSDGNGFSGNFVLNNGVLQFILTSVGNNAAVGGWNALNSNPVTYGNLANWNNNTINNVFTENIGTFNQNVQFTTSTALTGPLVINENSIPTTAYGTAPGPWAFVSSTATPSTLTLGGNLIVNNKYDNASPTTPGMAPWATTTVLFGYNPGLSGFGQSFNDPAVSGYDLAAIDLGGANRTISTNLPGDSSYAQYGLFIDTPITDSTNSGASVTKTGAGNLILGAANTFTGALNINDGAVTLLDQGTLASNQISISNGSELILTNNGADVGISVPGVVANRLTSSNLSTTSYGGEVLFEGSSTQSLGAVSLLQGQTTLLVGSIGNSATLAMTSLTRSAGTILLLPNLTQGAVVVGGDYVTAGTINGVAPVTNAVIPWALTGSPGGITGFAVYNSNGFQSASANDPNYISNTSFASTTSASDLQLTYTGPNNPDTVSLTASTAVNSLIINQYVNLSGSTSDVLTLGSGGLIMEGAAITNITLNFNNKEGVIVSSGGYPTNVIYVPIENARGLVLESTTPTNEQLVLSGSNPYNSNPSLTQYNWGATYIDMGKVTIANGSVLPVTSDVTVNSSTANAADPTNIPAILDLNGNGITIGALNGSGMVTLATLYPGESVTGTVNTAITRSATAATAAPFSLTHAAKHATARGSIRGLSRHHARRDELHHPRTDQDRRGHRNLQRGQHLYRRDHDQRRHSRLERHGNVGGQFRSDLERRRIDPRCFGQHGGAFHRLAGRWRGHDRQSRSEHADGGRQ